MIGTDEAPFEHLSLTIGIEDGVADMEQLTVVGNISVVSIHPALARELVHNVLADGVGIRDQAQGVVRVLIVL